MDEVGFHWTNFGENFLWPFLLKSVSTFHFRTNITDILHEGLHTFIIISRNVRDKHKECGTVRETGLIVDNINMALSNKSIIPCAKKGKSWLHLYLLNIFPTIQRNMECIVKNVERQLYKQTNRMHFLYVFILQFLYNCTCFERPFRSSSGVHDLLYSAALYKPCKRV